MIAFADSSALVKRYLDEEHGDLVAELSAIIASSLACVEVCSAIWRKQRLGELAAADAAILAGRARRDLTGGDPQVIEDPSRLPLAPDRSKVSVNSAGYIGSMNAEAVGLAAMALGAGRMRAEDRIDPGVGIIVHKKVGQEVRPGETVFEIYHRGGHGLSQALPMLGMAFTITNAPPAPSPLIYERLA